MIKIGDKVSCRLYNTPMRRSYGDYFTAIVVSIKTIGGDFKSGSWRTEKIYTVKYNVPGTIISRELDLKRYEIKNIL